MREEMTRAMASGDWEFEKINRFVVENVEGDSIFMSRRFGRLFAVAVRGGACDWAAYQMVLTDNLLDISLRWLERECRSNGHKVGKEQACTLFPVADDAIDLYRR